MTGTSKQLLLLSAAFALCAQSLSAKDLTKVQVEKPATAGTKVPFIIKRGDCELTVGGKLKIEHYYEDNAYLLNKNIPDENEYFKETIDLTLNAVYGKEKYGHKAIEAFADLRHKGVWGLALSYADRDAGPIAPSNIKFGNDTESLFGSHSHTSGKTLIWFKDAWLRFSLNAVFGSRCENLHFLQLGWFPFDMGRGIAFGGFYGLNKELLGLYSYPEDKSTPGINLHGTIIKDCLDYDIYYAKFEERNKNFSSTINLEKRHIVGRSGSPWRGINKDDDVIAGRLKWKALRDSKIGDLEFEPYVFYNAASDQSVESSFAPDAKSNWGSYGVALEHSFNNFEWGAEAAFNYGKEQLFNIDRNLARINNRNGAIVEEYSKIFDQNPTNAGAQRVLVTTATKAAAKKPVFTNGAQITGTSFWNATDRFRSAYENKLRGWMTVVDGGYTFEDWALKLAIAYGYASGDTPPHAEEKNKTYHGFVGLHELYSGKRVISIFLLDQRLLMRPSALSGGAGKVTASQDASFSDLQHVGFSATWTPDCFLKDLRLNPNIIAFWKAHETNKFVNVPNDPVTGAERGFVDPIEKARTFMGTELNLIASFSLLKDLKFFANFAAFIPGGFFSDVKGVPLDRDFFSTIVQDDRNDVNDASQFRLSNDTALHMNIGLEFKF